MKRTRMASIVSALALVAASGAGSALATEPISTLESQVDHDLPDVDAPQIGDSINEAELADLRTVAHQRGIPLQAAIDRYAWNDNFALAVSVIREGFPDSYAGAQIVDSERAWIGFSGVAPQGALDAINTFRISHASVAVEIRTDFGFAEPELAEAIERVHFEVLEAPGVKDVTTAFDYDTLHITSVVVPEGSPGETLYEDLNQIAENTLTDLDGTELSDRITTTVTESRSDVIGGADSNSEHLGGEALSQCTSGFGTKTGAGVRGISTAGHCNDSLSDDGSNLTFKADYEGTHGDFQWHTGPDTERDDFYSGNSTTTEVNKRDVSAVGSPVVGQALCKNGKTNHKQCQDVRKLNVCKSVYCNLVQMEARLAAGGDSGGPIFWSYTAYGLHQGWHYDIWPFDRDLFSRADRIDNALGISIATS